MMRAAKVAVKLIVTIGLLAFMISSTDLDALRTTAGQISPATIAASVFVLLCLAVIQAGRWRIILAALGYQFTHLVLLGWVLIGLFFSQLLPSSIGGDVMRVWKLHRAGAPPGKAFNSVLLDRITALVAAVLITSGGVMLTTLSAIPAVQYLVAGMLLAVGFGYAVLAMRESRLLGFIEKSLGERGGSIYHAVAGDMGSVLLNPRVMIPVISLSCLIHFGASTAVWMIASDAGADIQLATCVVLVPLVVLVSMVPVSIAGWGVREGAMVVAMGAVGVQSSIALTTSVIFGLALAATGLPGAAVWLYTRRSTEMKK